MSIYRANSDHPFSDNSHPKLSKPGMIANAQSKIQIVDTHESLETLINIDIAVGMTQFNRTLVFCYL